MAKLLAFYNLCPISDTKEFLGVARDAEPATIINTFGKNMAIVMKLSNQKQLNSWTVLDKFSSKVVYDFKKKMYVAVFANRFIRCWALSEINLNRVKKIKFYRNIDNIYNVHNQHTLVMYSDGSCESLESALETRKLDKENPSIDTLPNPGLSNTSIVKVNVLETNQSEYLLTYFKVNSATGEVELNYQLLDNETLKPVENARVIKIERVESNVKLLGYTIADGNYHPSLITIWSDKRIFMQQLRYQTKQETSGLGNFISMLNVINTEQPLTISSIGKDCVAIYAANPNLEGASIIIYNIQFKVVQARQFFKVFYNDSRLWTVDNNIFLAVGQQLSVIPFRVSREQLSDMLGSQKSANSAVSGTYVDLESINEEIDFDEAMCLDFDERFKDGILEMSTQSNGTAKNYDDDDPNKTQTSFIEQRLKTIEAAPKNGALTPFSCPYEVDKALRSLVQEDMTFELIYDETMLPGTTQNKLISSNSNNVLLFSTDFEVLATELEKCGASEYEISEKMLHLLIQAHATDDIRVCLRRYNTIPEKSLVKAIKYIMSLKPKAQQQKTKKKSKSKKSLEAPAEEQVDLLNLALSCTFIPSTIIPHLRQEIDMSTALLLCQHLYNIVTNDSEDHELFEMPENCENFDMDRQACEWLTVMLDSHYQQFVLTKDENVLQSLRQWRDHLNGYLTKLDDLRTLQAQIDLLVRRKKIDKEKKVNKWYSIESVELY